MKRRILFVAAGLAQAPAIREARQMGCYVIAVDGDSSAVGFSEADESHVADILDASEIVRVARSTGVDGIVSVCCDAAMEAVAKACVELGLPGISPEVVRVSRSKLLQREAMVREGLLVPQFAAVSVKEDAIRAWDRFGSAAVVIKPVDASGSRGVCYVDDRTRVAEAFEVARRNSRSGWVMVESFVGGTEYSVEAWVVGAKVEVLCTSMKVRTDPPQLLDRQVHFPDDLPEEKRAVMIEHAVRAIQACGFRDCPVHLECIFSEDGPMVVELAARGAGFKVFTEILPRVTGIQTGRVSVHAALGEPLDLSGKGEFKAASLVFVDPVPGTFRTVVGVEVAAKLSGVSEIVIYPKEGQRMNPLCSGADRAGHVLVYGGDAESCRAVAQEALAVIRIETQSLRGSP
jgi:biotin carboxylase